MARSVNSLLEQNKAERSKLFGSLLLFTQVFYKLRTGRSFQLSNPTARETHFISICRELVKVFRGETDLLVINVPPRYGKTELLIHFIAWSMARYPDCNFLYTSYSHNLAAKQSATIRDIMMMPEYRDLFLVNIKHSSHAKFDFESTENGSVYAAGFGGTITGRGAGIKGSNRFGGAIIIDDAHKPSEAHSDTIREGVISWYHNTLLSRRNDGNKTPIIFIGQRVHEEDLPSHILEGIDVERRTVLSLPALDEAQNALYPEMHTKDELFAMQAEDPYTFAAQMQQNPQPAGGGIYKKVWFPIISDMPKVLMTFITCDTAETDKDYNDATVFSFWGLYKISQGEFETDLYGLHWLDCSEIRVEPKDLESEFMQFYYACMHFDTKPSMVAIEKKSTGVTLSSVLDGIQGLHVLQIERTRASGSKTTRFLEIQKYIAAKRVTFQYGAKHAEMCIDHCAKITANDSHRRDDICDTLYDAVKIALIDNSLVNMYIPTKQAKSDEIVRMLAASHNRLKKVRGDREWLK